MFRAESRERRSKMAILDAEWKDEPAGRMYQYDVGTRWDLDGANWDGDEDIWIDEEDT